MHKTLIERVRTILGVNSLVVEQITETADLVVLERDAIGKLMKSLIDRIDSNYKDLSICFDSCDTDRFVAILDDNREIKSDLSVLSSLL